jgi:hypothetical protein
MKNFIFWAVGILFTLFIMTIIFRFGLVFDSSLNDWYEMSGIVTSGVTALLLFTTLIIIREAMKSNIALQESNAKLQTANDEMRGSNIKLLFNSTFHPLLSQSNLILNEFRKEIENINFDKRVVINNFLSGNFIENSFKQGTGHDYFRVLYQILNIIKNSDLLYLEQKTYSNILRAFIDNKTLYYVALNASQKINNNFMYPEYMTLIEYFQLLEHLNILSIKKGGIEHPFIDMNDFILNYKQDAYGDKVNVNAFVVERLKIVKDDSDELYSDMKEIIGNYRQVKKSPFENLVAATDNKVNNDYLMLQKLKRTTILTFDKNTTFLSFCSILENNTGEAFIYGEVNDFINFQEKLNSEYQTILENIKIKALDETYSIHLFISLRETRRRLKWEMTKLFEIQETSQED